MNENNGFEPAGNVGLEPLGKYRSTAMSSTMRDVFDVLYEVGEPLAPEEISTRTFERASGAAHFHAQRATIRERVRRRKRPTSDIPLATAFSKRDIPLEEAWLSWLKALLRDARLRHVLIRDDQGRYAPNPDKPPRAARVDGTIYPYTRQAWLETTAHERTVGEVHTMAMEVERFLGGRDRDELLLVLEVFVDNLTGFGNEKRRPLNPRTVRTQLRWLLERPTTDQSRAWLLHELTRRIFE